MGGQRWYVVAETTKEKELELFKGRDEDGRPYEVWTLSLDPETPGWNTDSAYNGYGLTYDLAKELADAANEKWARQRAPGSVFDGKSPISEA
jgi:hypothetical protein